MEIIIDNYTKIFKPNNVVLNQINYRFEGGRVYGLYGKNGSGKTMLMRAISGLIFPTEGKVLIDNKELRKDIDFPDSIGVLLENPYFLNYYNGFDNLRLLAAIKNRISDDDIKKCLEKVGLDPNEKKKVKKYSLGMKQRLGIAAAIMEKPDILLLDEPFNAIDENSYDLIRNIINEFKASGKIVIIANHDLEELSVLCDEIVKMSNGKIV